MWRAEAAYFLQDCLLVADQTPGSRSGCRLGAAYRLLGASTDNKSAMLYSVNALTSYGHEELYLAPRWKLMGALEALNSTCGFHFSLM
jgi:hypothetical protein